MIGTSAAYLERFLKRLSRFLPIAASCLLAACSAGVATGVPPSGSVAAPELPPPLARMLSDRPAPPIDTMEVWVCDVPAGATAAVYGGLTLREPLTPDGIVAAIGDRLHAYVDTVSGGRTDLRLVSGGTVAMDIADDDDACAEAALDRSSAGADVVLAVATAQHDLGQPGGRGRPGSSLACTGSCAAATTGRAIVVGANDFHATWGALPLLDLIEHEYGHTFGLPHSGTEEPGDDEYLSAIDLMSNSAAPRDVHPDRRDGPMPLAIDLVDVGWLALDRVVVAPSGAEALTVELTPTSEPAVSPGARLVVLPVDEHRLVSIEARTPTGFDDHLPEAGVAVHEIDDRAGIGVLRVQVPLHTDVVPFTDLLGAGDVLVVDGWRIEVRAVGATAHLAIVPTDG